MKTWIEIAVELILKSSVVLALTLITVRTLRQQSAALKHTVLSVGLLCSLALPVFSLVLPAWRVAPAVAVQYSQPRSFQTPVVSQSRPVTVHATTAPAQKPLWVSRERMLLLLWMIGILSVASLLLREAIQLASIAIGASVVYHTSWRTLVQDISNALRLRREVGLLRNPDASVLGTWGAIRPRVLLPAESDSWSTERRRVVLAHELAHVKRNDWLVQVIAELARAVCWFNPLFWIACSKLRRESEHACDDAVMNLGGEFIVDGPTYAEHVLDLARTLKHHGQPASAALAMANPSNLERRLIAMLNPSLNRSATSLKAAAIVVVLALCVTVPLAALSSQAAEPAAGGTYAVFAPRARIEPVPAPIRTAPVVQRTLPGTIIAVAAASPIVPAETLTVAAAQNPSGTFSGSVSDPSGAVIPGVLIQMKARSTGLIQQGRSNESGNFSFTQLAPDDYSFTLELPGFQPSAFLYTLKDPGSTARVRFTLGLAPLNVVAYVSGQCSELSGNPNANGLSIADSSCVGGSFVSGTKPSPQTPIELAPINAVVVDPSSTIGSPPAIQPNGRPYPIRVGGDIQLGIPLSLPTSALLAQARNKGVQGIVTVMGVIGADGRLRSLKIAESSNPLLEPGVIEVLQTWTFRPTLLNRQPVESPATITLNYKLGL